MLPEVGSINRLMQRSSVDFPEPLNPMTAKNWPLGTEKLTSWSACMPPSYVLLRFSIRSIMGFGKKRTFSKIQGEVGCFQE